MLEHTPLPNLAARFERFARLECRGSSPLYEELSLGIAADPVLLEIAAHSRLGQPVPNLFFAAVHYLLLRGLEHPLKAFYPSLNFGSVPKSEVYPLFHDFCLKYTSEILEIIKSRLVQTNEIRRCACLLPAFGLVATDGKPLALLEIGASAGLNLLWDSYGYDYGTGGKFGNPNSLVQLKCELRGEFLPPLPAQMPPVSFRLGLDLNPIDVTDADAILWLKALLWPEHRYRRETLEKALEIAKLNPPKLLAGDALELLPKVWENVPPDATLCVYHSFTVNQFSPLMRERLSKLLDEEATRRDLSVISLEWTQGKSSPTLSLLSYRDGEKTGKLLGNCEGHAGWLEWLGPTSDKD